MPKKNLPLTGFDEMNLSLPVFSALQDVGYDTPTPIQAAVIPHMIEKKDLLAQARTGTGKTAAFALPLLSQINLGNKRPQVLVLTPTRELAIQVGSFFKAYGAKMKGLNVLSVYGGQSYTIQLNQLRRGVHVVVGTTGRLMDLMRKKAVSFDNLSCVVIDEADEMLHMGFIEDVEWILEKTPDNSQTALFSATMPKPIRKIAQKYLTDPEEIIIEPDNKEIDTICQKYWMVRGVKKNQALTRILSSVSFDGVIVFVKTKTSTLEVAKTLEDQGFKAEALNGDLAQNARERTINRLKNGNIDILVATDVAARGLDVDRISHVINYDMPPKVDPYIHRIGRTGRAGRTGEAILFVGRNERYLLKAIERKTKKKIKEIPLPSNNEINEKRIADFKINIEKNLESNDVSVFQKIIEAYSAEQDIPLAEVAAALAKMASPNTPFLLPIHKPIKKSGRKKSSDNLRKKRYTGSSKTPGRKKPSITKPFAEKMEKAVSGKEKENKLKNNIAVDRQKLKKLNKKISAMPETNAKIIPIKKGMDRYRIEIGSHHGIKPGDIVGAISNEAGLESRYIGNIEIDNDFSFVDLPSGMPGETFKLLKKTWVKSRKMAISKCA